MRSTRARTTIVVWSMVGILVAFVLAMTSRAFADVTRTFFPVADASIKPDFPKTNYGTSRKVVVDNSPVEQFLLKFSISGIGSEPVVSAKLLLYNVSDSPAGGDFHRVADNGWSEETVTWDNAPAADPAIIASLGAVVSRRWYEVSLASLIVGDGTYSLRVTTTANNGADYVSKEGGGATYSPRLVVTTGAVGSRTAPTANAGPNQVSPEGTMLTFIGSATGTGPFTYRWNFGDGTGGATGSPASHAYRDNGTYPVTLTVTDAVSRTAQATALATIYNVAPAVNAGGPYSGVVGSPTAFAGTAKDPSSVDTSAGLGYSWDFGDGTGGTGGSLSHVYSAAGVYTVRLRVTDKDGGSGSATSTTTVTVDDPPQPPPPPPTASCLSQPGPLTAITGVQTWSYDKTSLQPDAMIDATGAVWYELGSNPVVIGGGPGICWSAGLIEGNYPPDLHWSTFHSTAGLKTVSAVDVTIANVHIQTYGDGIKLYQGTESFTIQGVYLHDLHDDCIEGDWLPGGVIKDSLLDGCYQAFAARPRSSDSTSDGSNKTWVIRNTLAYVRPQIGVYKGPSPGNGAFFKWDTDSPSRSPKVAISDTILRIDQYPNHTESGLWVLAGKLESCSNVTIVWLGGGPYPVSVPPCVTVTTDVWVWDRAVADWKARHGMGQ